MIEAIARVKRFPDVSLLMPASPNRFLLSANWPRCPDGLVSTSAVCRTGRASSLVSGIRVGVLFHPLHPTSIANRSSS